MKILLFRTCCASKQTLVALSRVQFLLHPQSQFFVITFSLVKNPSLAHSGDQQKTSLTKSSIIIFFKTSQFWSIFKIIANLAWIHSYLNRLCEVLKKFLSLVWKCYCRNVNSVKIFENHFWVGIQASFCRDLQGIRKFAW